MVRYFRIFLIFAVIATVIACGGRDIPAKPNKSDVDKSLGKKEGGEEKGGEEEVFDNNVQTLVVDGHKLPPLVDIPETPNSWADCWVADRVVGAFAFAVKSNYENAIGGLTEPVVEGKDEIKPFTITNPNITASCQLNWLQPPALPAGYPQGIDKATPNWNERDIGTYCIAPVDPLCRCFAFTYPDDISLISVGLCQERQCTDDDDCQWGKLHNTLAPKEGQKTANFDGCETAFLNAYERAKDNTESDFDAEGCRVDHEPLNPRIGDEDWYGHDIRDTIVVTCENGLTPTDQQPYNLCRCYIIGHKPTAPPDGYVSTSHTNVCTKCMADGSCYNAGDIPVELQQ